MIEGESKKSGLIKYAALCIFPISALQDSLLAISYVRVISICWCITILLLLTRKTKLLIE